MQEEVTIYNLFDFFRSALQTNLNKVTADLKTWSVGFIAIVMQKCKDKELHPETSQIFIAYCFRHFAWGNLLILDSGHQF